MTDGFRRRCHDFDVNPFLSMISEGYCSHRAELQEKRTQRRAAPAAAPATAEVSNRKKATEEAPAGAYIRLAPLNSFAT